MKKAITFFLLILNTNSFGQNDFSSQIQNVADTLSKKIIQSGNKKVAVVEFINLDESITQLGQFLCDELSSDLSNLTGNLTKFEIIERSNIELIFKEKKLIQSTDGSRTAKDIGNLNVADILIWAIISDFEGYYRVNIKLLDTKTGSAISAFKTQFIKSPTLENYNKNIIRNKSTGYLISNQPKIESQVESPISVNNNSQCEKNQTGTLSITNNWKYGSARNESEHKIIVRIPKNDYPRGDDEYYYISLDKGETKEFESLKEGLYSYEVKQFCSSGFNGWCFTADGVASGQFQIAKCKTKTVIIH